MTKLFCCIAILLSMLVVAPQSKAATPWTNFYLSGDGGQFFKEVKTSSAIIDLGKDTSDKDRLIGLSHHGIVVESYDDGNTWRDVAKTEMGRHAETIKLFISKHGIIFTYGGNGLHRIDGTRAAVRNKSFDYIYNMNSLPSGEIILTGTESTYAYKRLFISSDDGHSWKRLFDEGTYKGSYRTASGQPVHYNATDDGVYVSLNGTVFTYNPKKIFRYTDTQKEELPFDGALTVCSSSSGRILARALSKKDRSEDIYVSGDDGKRWEKILKDEEIGQILQGESQALIIIDEVNGKLTKYRSSQAFGDVDHIVHCNASRTSGSGDYFRSECFLSYNIQSDMAKSWRSSMKIDYKKKRYKVIETAPVDGVTLLADGARLYRTDNNGKNWKEDSIIKNSIRKIIVDPRDKKKVYVVCVEWPDI